MARDLFKGELVYTLRIVSWFIQPFFVSIIIVSFFNNKLKRNSSYPDLLSLSFWAVIIASFTSYILLTSDPINNFYNSLIIIDPISEKIGLRIYRGYGVGEDLSFTYSYLLGFVAGYICYILNKRAWYIVFLPFLIIRYINLIYDLFTLLIIIFKIIYHFFYCHQQANHILDY